MQRVQITAKEARRILACHLDLRYDLDQAMKNHRLWPAQHMTLLHTGAKLYFYQNRWYLNGYAADGSDVELRNIIPEQYRRNGEFA